MRAVIQRVKKSSVHEGNKELSLIGKGLLILLGVEDADHQEDVRWLAKKITQMRIFSDDQDKMNLSVIDICGAIIVVSQFTLHASTKKGNRPSFIRAAKPEDAKKLYEDFIHELKVLGVEDVQSGEFGAMMNVALINEGPVTIIIDSKNKE